MPASSCPRCSAPLSEGLRFCARCGADSLEASAETTRATRTSFNEGEPPPSSRQVTGGQRFEPGTLIAGRYRIVALLGRGGMGEVYRADDLKLGRPIALKFLPERVERDPARLNRFLGEVRTALSVSHPNVCRVHDVNQEGGRHFITMEFVDGDDLSVLLRRIGRLPRDKALEISRQLCAGLAAAHAAGIVHRDLKPANVMIDGRGQVKITDFGLAGLAGEIGGAEVRVGTPAYMAPEQLAGDEVSERSDIYALGLVLYELYTGKSAYEGTTAAEIARRKTSAPTSPSSHVTDIDPAVERVIMRCLEQDPSERPRSAMAVSAALPGGDPLADALAAGETPAPQLVAEAGAVGGLEPWVAWSVLVAFVAVMVLNIGGVERYSIIPRADLPKSGEILQDRARDILASLGLPKEPVDSYYEFNWNVPYIEDRVAPGSGETSLDFLERSQPTPITFGYLHLPTWGIFENAGGVNQYIERALRTELPGTARVYLDPEGRLLSLDVRPYERDAGARTAPAPEAVWEILLDAAGLEMNELEEVEPEWLPQHPFDSRRAWAGVYPDASEFQIRVEAATLYGSPVGFRIVEPWTSAVLPEASGYGSVRADRTPFEVLVFMTGLAAACFFAWRNVRLGRGDTRTAVRFALVLTALRFSWYVLADHAAAPGELWNFNSHLSWTLQRFGLAYVYYLAIEPYARRIAPHILTSWVRFFDARFRDPLVGRDLLVGLMLGGLGALVTLGTSYLCERLGHIGAAIEYGNWARESLRGIRGALLGRVGQITTSVLNCFNFVVVAFVFRLILRRDWLVMPPMMVVLLLLPDPKVPFEISLTMAVLWVIIFWVAPFRFGLLALVVTATSFELIYFSSLTFDLGAWWSGSTWLTLGSLGVLALWSFRAALAGRPVFRDGLGPG